MLFKWKRISLWIMWLATRALNSLMLEHFALIIANRGHSNHEPSDSGTTKHGAIFLQNLYSSFYVQPILISFSKKILIKNFISQIWHILTTLFWSHTRFLTKKISVCHINHSSRKSLWMTLLFDTTFILWLTFNVLIGRLREDLERKTWSLGPTLIPSWLQY